MAVQNNIIDGVGVQVGVENSGLRAGLTESAAMIKNFSSTSVTALNAVRVAGLAMVAGITAFATGAGFHALSSVATELENIGVQARTLGITTQELQELGHVARRVDIDQQTLNAGLDKFNVILGQVRAGTGPLTESLKLMNPELLNNLKNATSLREGLELLADASTKLGSQQDRAAFAQLAFSRGGVELLRILELGRGGIKDLADEANKLGFVFSDLQIQAGGELSDAIEEAAIAFEKQLKKAIIELGPIMLRFIDFGTMVIASLRGIASAIKDVFTTSAAESVKKLSDTAKILEDDLVRLSEVSRLNPVGPLPIMQQQIEQKRGELQAVRDELTAAQAQLERETTGPMGPTAPPATAPAKPGKGLDELRKEHEEALKKAEDDRRIALETHNKELEKYIALQKLRKDIEAQVDPVAAQLAATQEKLGNALQKSAIDANTYGIAMSKAAALAMSSYANMAGNIVSDLGKVFGESKGFAIATALINTFQAVTNAWANVPWPLNIAAAAAALAAGLTQVANIRSTNKDGGGGGGTSASSAEGATAAAAPEQGRTMTVQGISLQEMYSGEGMRNVIQGIIDYQRDGGTVVLK